MWDIRFQGLRLEVTLAAARELLHEGLDLTDVVDILEQGHDCGTGRRSAEIRERCLRRGKRVWKAVVAETRVRHPDGESEKVWRLIHVGSFTYSRRHAARRET